MYKICTHICRVKNIEIFEEFPKCLKKNFEILLNFSVLLKLVILCVLQIHIFYTNKQNNKVTKYRADGHTSIPTIFMSKDIQDCQKREVEHSRD